MGEINPNKLYGVCFCDPSGGSATGGSSSTHSRSSIVAIGADPEERVFIRRAWAAHCPTSTLIENIFKFNYEYRPSVFGIDATGGGQSAFADTIIIEARNRGESIPLRKVKLTANKLFTIETVLQPLAASGRLFRPPEPECRELMEEWKNFPAGSYRDCLDALANAIKLLPAKPLEEVKARGREFLRLYLTKIGKSQREIEERLARC